MNELFGKATTAIRRKVNELVAGYNSNVAVAGLHTTTIASILAGNIGEYVAAAGDAIGNAKALAANKFVHRVTGADGTKGVQLPTGVAGMTHVVLNTVNAVLKVYPQAAQKIESGTAGAALEGTALYGYFFTYADDTIGWETAKFLLVAS